MRVAYDPTESLLIRRVVGRPNFAEAFYGRALLVDLTLG